MRLEAHVALSCSVTTPSFDTKAAVEQLRLIYVPAGAPVVDPASATLATPAKRGGGASLSAANTPAAAPTATAATPAVAPLALGVLSLEELLMVAGDLRRLEDWLLAEYSTSAAAALSAKQTAGTGSGSFQVDLQGVDAVRGALVRQVTKLQGARDEIWTKITALLGAECRKCFSSLKAAIVTKYKMTTKPPPVNPGDYVGNIFQPLNQFLSQHRELIPLLAAAPGEKATDGVQRWTQELAEEVTQSFVEQLSQVIESEKQLSKSLQGRSRVQPSSSTSSGATAGLTDAEKIALQIRLDVEAFGKKLQALQVETGDFPAYQALCELKFETN